MIFLERTGFLPVRSKRFDPLEAAKRHAGIAVRFVAARQGKRDAGRSQEGQNERGLGLHLTQRIAVGSLTTCCNENSQNVKNSEHPKSLSFVDI